MAADMRSECDLAEGVTLGERMRWGQIRAGQLGIVQQKIPAVLRKCFLHWYGREARHAGRRIAVGKQGPPARLSGDIPDLAAGQVCPSHRGREGTYSLLPCSEAEPMVGAGVPGGSRPESRFQSLPQGPGGAPCPVLSCR